MLDVINLPIDTMKECSLSDLPISLMEQVRRFLIDNETPNLCILRKNSIGNIYVYAITPFCIITVANKIKNRVLAPLDLNNSTRCILISRITSIEYKHLEKDNGEIHLGIDSGETAYYEFCNDELLNKFETILFSLVRQNRPA